MGRVRQNLEVGQVGEVHPQDPGPGGVDPPNLFCDIMGLQTLHKRVVSEIIWLTKNVFSINLLICYLTPSRVTIGKLCLYFCTFLFLGNAYRKVIKYIKQST